jgi:hypothetical protein
MQQDIMSKVETAYVFFLVRAKENTTIIQARVQVRVPSGFATRTTVKPAKKIIISFFLSKKTTVCVTAA